MATKTLPSKSVTDLPLVVARQMLQLATSGLGLAAALAWNELVRTAIEEYIKPYVPQGGNLVSLLIYAVIVTILAVAVTLQLTRLAQHLEASSPKIAR